MLDHFFFFWKSNVKSAESEFEIHLDLLCVFQLGRNILMTTAFEGHTEVVQLLLTKRSNINDKDKVSECLIMTKKFLLHFETGV